MVTFDHFSEAPCSFCADVQLLYAIVFNTPRTNFFMPLFLTHPEQCCILQQLKMLQLSFLGLPSSPTRMKLASCRHPLVGSHTAWTHGCRNKSCSTESCDWKSFCLELATHRNKKQKINLEKHNKRRSEVGSSLVSRGTPRTAEQGSIAKNPNSNEWHQLLFQVVVSTAQAFGEIKLFFLDFI